MIINFRIIYIVCIIISLSACNNQQKRNTYFKKPENTEKNIQLTTLNLDTIQLDSIYTSHVGFSTIRDKNIYFMDSKFCRIFLFDRDGNFNKTCLRQGRGPKEFPGSEIDFYAPLSNNKHLLYGGNNYTYHVFNKNWERERTLQINYKWRQWSEKKQQKMMENYTPETSGLYGRQNTEIKRHYSDYIYWATESTGHPEFNFFLKKYYKEARIIQKFNVLTGEIEEYMGRYSPVYQDYNCIPQFSNIIFDISNKGNFYISFEADSLIHLYNNKMNYQQSFGFEGRNMNKNYKEYSQVPSSISKFWNESREEKKLKGYYTWLEYIDERKLLFRVYKKGNHEVSNGLQVYDKNGTLIGDVNIPENFTQIIGYIEPYFYSNIFINPETWTMKIYRFTIEEI